MKPARGLLFVLSILSLSALVPLSADAAPRAVTNRAKCIASDSDIVTITNDGLSGSGGLSGNSFIRARVASGAQNSAGLRLRVVGIKRPGPNVNFRNLFVLADLKNADPASCFLVLDFDMPGNRPDERRIVSFAQAGVQFRSSIFTSYAINNNRQVKGVGDGNLKALAVLVQGGSSGSQEITIGVIDIDTRGEDRSKTELLTRDLQSSCDLLPAP